MTGQPTAGPPTPAARVVVLADDPDAGRAVAGALGLLGRHCREVGRPVPSWLLGALVERADPALNRQEPPPLDESAHLPHGDQVLLDYRAAAELLSIGVRTVERLVADGHLVARRIGRSRRIRRVDLEEFAERLPTD